MFPLLLPLVVFNPLPMEVDVDGNAPPRLNGEESFTLDIDDEDDDDEDGGVK